MILVLICVLNKSLDSCNRGRGIRDIVLNFFVFEDVWEKSSEKLTNRVFFVFCGFF